MKVELNPSNIALINLLIQAINGKECNVAFSRLSKQDITSWLGSVEHTVTLKSRKFVDAMCHVLDLSANWMD
jgi:hypothetical protein